MSGHAYRIFVDGQPATRAFSAAIDEVIVDQVTDAPWEAQLHIPTQLNPRGRWDEEAQVYAMGRTRFRIELRVGGGEWIPLIDGTTRGADVAASGEPNASAITLYVRDDLAELQRGRVEESFGEGRRVDAVIRDVFSRHDDRFEPVDVDLGDDDDEPDERHAPDEHVITEISDYEFLRRLAEERGAYVYALPGANPGDRSTARFGRMPETPANEKPPHLVLAGPHRNIERFDARIESDRPGSATARRIDIGRRVVETNTITLRDRDLDPNTEAGGDEDIDRPVPARDLASVGPGTAAATTLERAGHVVQADGVIDGRCYGGVLRPYRHVDVIGVNRRLTGTYIIENVTHTLSRAGYRQAFSLWRNRLAIETVLAGAESPP
jgi:hypothetical protein